MNAQRILAKFICGYFQSLGDFRYMILSLENEENNPCEVNVLKQNSTKEVRKNMKLYIWVGLPCGISILISSEKHSLFIFLFIFNK